MSDYILQQIAEAETRERALEIALIQCRAYTRHWRRDVACKLLPYPEGFDSCDAVITAADQWPHCAPLALAQAAE